jgi:hypothetical protein
MTLAMEASTLALPTVTVRVSRVNQLTRMPASMTGRKRRRSHQPSVRLVFRGRGAGAPIGPAEALCVSDRSPLGHTRIRTVMLGGICINGLSIISADYRLADARR